MVSCWGLTKMQKMFAPPHCRSFTCPTLQLGSEGRPFHCKKGGKALLKNSHYKMHMCYHSSSAGGGQPRAEERFQKLLVCPRFGGAYVQSQSLPSQSSHGRW